jgi:hypothetical protein
VPPARDARDRRRAGSIEQLYDSMGVCQCQWGGSLGRGRKGESSRHLIWRLHAGVGVSSVRPDTDKAGAGARPSDAGARARRGSARREHVCANASARAQARARRGCA